MYALISHKVKGEKCEEDKLVWYIGLVENRIARPIPELEAERICNLLNAIMAIPEENLKSLLMNIKNLKGGR